MPVYSSKNPNIKTDAVNKPIETAPPNNSDGQMELKPTLTKEVLFNSKCLEHERPLEFFCVKDGVLVCCHCIFIGSHIQHETIIIREMNKRYSDALRNKADRLYEIKKQSKGDLENQHNSTLPSGKYQIAVEFFDEFEAKFNAKKKTFLNNLTDTFITKAGQSKSSQNTIDSLLDAAGKILSNPNIPVRITDLLSEMESAIKLNSTVSEKKEEPQISYAKDLDRIINSLAQIEVPNINSKQIEKPRTKENLTPSTSPSVNEIANSLLTDCQLYNYIASQVLTVTVAYFQTPSCFWILPSENRILHLGLKESIKQWSRANSFETHNVNPVEGGVYLAKLDGEFLRVQVVKTFDIYNNDYVKVHYMDFGKSDVLESSKLKPILKEQAVYKPLVQQCELHNFRPKGNRWTKKTVERFSELVKGQAFEMEIFNNKDGVLQVDLRAINFQDNGNKVSIQDLLKEAT